MLLNSMCIQETTVGYWQLDSRWSQYSYPDIYDTHVLYYVKYESCSSRPSPTSEGRTATGGHIEHPTNILADFCRRLWSQRTMLQHKISILYKCLLFYKQIKFWVTSHFNRLWETQNLNNSRMVDHFSI